MAKPINLYCPACNKYTMHRVLPNDRMSFNGRRIWELTCNCGLHYSVQMQWDDPIERVIMKLLDAREECKMFWKPEEIEREKTEERLMSNIKKKNSEVIDQPDYYLLPSGLHLEDFIYERKLNFNMGSALKYLWRAGYKDGESLEKDLSKAEHYIRFEAKCRGVDYDVVDWEVKDLLEEAYRWRQHEELEDGVAK